MNLADVETIRIRKYNIDTLRSQSNTQESKMKSCCPIYVKAGPGNPRQWRG